MKIRIVGGNYIEEAGEDYEIYSEGNIITTAGGTITEKGVEKGVSYGAPKDPPIIAPEIMSKCMVQFRPHNNWSGEFGFDWLRAGDTGRKGDNWFGKIMGKYYEADNKTVFQNSNSWSNNFHIERKLYNRKLRSYENMLIGWKSKNDNPYFYPIPRLTLMKGRTAKLNLKIEIEELPQKLTIEFENKKAEQFLQLNHKKITDIKKGKYDKSNFLTITCTKEFDKTQKILIKADDKVCGALKILPNDVHHQLPTDVVFIKVKTQINVGFQWGAATSGGKDFFIQCLNQALVVPNIVEEQKYLDCTGSMMGLISPFRSQFCSLQRGSLQFYLDDTKTGALRHFLETETVKQFGSKYDLYYKVFFIADNSMDYDSSGKLQPVTNGFSNFNSQFVVCFGTHNKATIAHELFHAFGLPHIFDGVHREAKYTYEAYKTDNLMDYSHHMWASIACLYFTGNGKR